MDWINLGIIQLYLNKRVIVKQETKQKRNETKQAETKRNETQQKRNETNKIIKKTKKQTNINETIFATWDNNSQNASDGLKNL
jgi:hypothetical protein